MHGRRQRSHSFDEDQDGEWWPPPLTEQDVATRQRATRLLQAIRQIPLVYYDIKAWENQHENVFSLFRQGCLDAANSNILEAPLYNNRQIQDAWLFLLEMRRRHKNRGKHVQECARVLGASYNWSIVLQGSKKVLEALNDLPQEVCTEILEGADAHELLRSIYPQRRPRRDDWMNTPSSLPANGWSDSDPSWMGKDTPNGAGTRDAWPDAAWPDAGRTKNPFKAEGVATEWPDPPAQVPQTPGQRDVFPGPTGGSFASAAAIPEKSAFGRPDTNPFRKEASPKSGNPFNAAAIPEKSAFGRPDTNPFRKEVAPKSGNPFHAQRIPAGV